MTTRQLRPDEPKSVRKSLSLTQELADDIQAQADREGHRNFSAVVVKAVREYLARVFGTKEAA